MSRLLTRRFVLGCLAFYAVWFAVTTLTDHRWTHGFLGEVSAISYDGLFFVLSPLLLVLLIAVAVFHGSSGDAGASH